MDTLMEREFVECSLPLWCFLCGQGIDNRNFANDIFQNSTVHGHKKISECFADVLQVDIVSESAAMSRAICQECHELAEELEVLSSQLSNLQQKIRNLFHRTKYLVQMGAIQVYPSSVLPSPEQKDCLRPSKKPRKMQHVLREELPPLPEIPQKETRKRCRVDDEPDQKPVVKEIKVEPKMKRKRVGRAKRRFKKKLDLTEKLAAAAAKRDAMLLKKQEEAKQKKRYMFDDSEFESESDEDRYDRDPSFGTSKRSPCKRLRQRNVNTKLQDQPVTKRISKTRKDYTACAENLTFEHAQCVLDSDDADESNINNDDPLNSDSDNDPVPEELIFNKVDICKEVILGGNTDIPPPISYFADREGDTNDGRPIRVASNLFQIIPDSSKPVLLNGNSPQDETENNESYENQEISLTSPRQLSFQSLDSMCERMMGMSTHPCDPCSDGNITIKVEPLPAEEQDATGDADKSLEIFCDICGEDFVTKEQLSNHFELDHFSPTY